MGGFQLKNISRYISSMKSESKRNSQLKEGIQYVNTVIRDFDKGNIPELNVLEIMKFFYELGLRAEADKKAIENSSDVDMPELLSGEENVTTTEVIGLFGKQIYNSVEDVKNNTESSLNNQMNQKEQIPPQRNAEWISEKIETDSNSVDLEVSDLAFSFQGGDDFENKSHCCQPQIDDQSLFRLNKVFASLQNLLKLERRHQALAYASLGPPKDFTCLYKSFTNFFICLKIWQDMATNDQMCTLLKEALQSSWILKDGPKPAIKITKDKGLFKSAPSKSFDIQLRFLCDHKWLQLDFRGEPILSLESKDGDAVSCKVKYEKLECQNNSVLIKKISFENLERLSGPDLALYQNFYVLKLNLQVSYKDNHIDLELRTFPFTVYESAHQIQESTGAVTWLVFSQEEKKGDEYELKKDLPRKDVLQMFDLMLKYNTDKGGRYLDEKEVQELGRLLGRQNPGNSVEMKSIFIDKMKAQDCMKRHTNVEHLEFSLFTWFQGGLNTLAHFHDYWKRGLILGFYSKKDASELFQHGRKEGDAAIRLSQHEMHHRQGETPLTALTVHIVRPNKKFFIGSFQVAENSSFQNSVLKFVDEPTAGDINVPSIKQFLPKRIPLSDVCTQPMQHYAGSVEMNRYCCRLRTRPVTCELMSERFGAMSLEAKPPPGNQIADGDQIDLQQQIPNGEQIPFWGQIAHQHQNDHKDQSPLDDQRPDQVDFCPHSVSESSNQEWESEKEEENWEPPHKKPFNKYLEISTGRGDPLMTSTVLPEDLQNLSNLTLFFANP